jgi:acetylornithine deacetylase
VTLDPVELLCDLVRVPSPSGDEGAAAALLAERLFAAGLTPHVVGRNVWCAVGPDHGPTILLCSHLDTVPIGEGWTRPPLEAKREGERIYGRGSNDAKGCLAAMTAALVRLGAAGTRARVVLAAVCEEETGGLAGLPALLPHLGTLDAAVIGEPTGLVPVCAQKGLLALDATARGRQAHAARPEEGDNAIAAAARAIAALDAFEFEARSEALGPPTAEVTMIKAGERRNVIPASCWFALDVRTTPEYDTPELVQLIGRVLGPEVLLSVKGAGARAQATPVDHPVIRAAVAATGAAAVGSPTVSDWARLDGVPAVKLGPGESPRSHTPDEYVTVVELERGADVYARLVEGWLVAREARG